MLFLQYVIIIPATDAVEIDGVNQLYTRLNKNNNHFYYVIFTLFFP